MRPTLSRRQSFFTLEILFSRWGRASYWFYLVRTTEDIGYNIKSKLLCFAVKRKPGQKLKSRDSHSRSIPASPWRIQFSFRKRYYLGALKGSLGSEITGLKCQGLDYFYGNLQQVSSELSSRTRTTSKRNPCCVTLLLHLRHWSSLFTQACSAIINQNRPA